MLKLLLPILLAFLPGCGTPAEIRVVDVATGEPVHGALVRSIELSSMVPTFNPFSGSDEDTTDDTGVATLRINRRDTLGFEVTLAGYKHHGGDFRDWHGFSEMMRARTDPDAPIRWTEYVERGDGADTFHGSPLRIRIVVIDHATKAPIQGAIVRAGPNDPFPTTKLGQTIVYIHAKDDRVPSVEVPGMRGLPRPFPEWWRFKRTLEQPHEELLVWTIEMAPSPAPQPPSPR